MGETAGSAAAKHQPDRWSATLAADMAGIDDLAWNFDITHHVPVYAPFSKRLASSPVSSGAAKSATSSL
jgi:hypothetical protein